MTITHHSLIKWEKNLKKVLDDLDDLLESRFGTQYPLHPARSKRGSTANKAHDGLFDITAAFSLGTGSDIGKGYVVDIHMVTLEKVPEKIKTKINNATLKILRSKLPEYFPGRNLKVDKEGHIIKIYGDLSLGDL